MDAKKLVSCRNLLQNLLFSIDSQLDCVIGLRVLEVVIASKSTSMTPLRMCSQSCKKPVPSIYPMEGVTLLDCRFDSMFLRVG